MSIKTGRAQGVAEVRIDRGRCTVCGLCVKVCTGGPLHADSNRIEVDQARYFGCIACGQCVAVCPQGCIEVEGRDLLPSDVLALPERAARADYASLRNLMVARRSIRQYEDRPVDRDLIEQILQAASTAPMGIPPTDVGVLVLEGKEKVQRFRDDLLDSMKKMKKSRMFALMRLFMGKDMREMFNTFILPMIDVYVEKAAVGEDVFFYDAPLAMFFYTSSIGDPVDPTIAATYAMLAAESLGLGSCMLGFPAPVFKTDRSLSAKYGLPAKITPGIALVFGYPGVRYHRAVQRRFAAVTYA